MTLSYPQAIDEMFQMFESGFEAASIPILRYVPEIWYEGVEKPNSPEIDKFWCRVSERPVSDTQSAFRNGENGQCYTATGILFVQIFAPKIKNDSHAKLILLADAVKKIFQGESTSGKVWFRNARVRKLNPETEWWPINVIVEYEFSEEKV